MKATKRQKQTKRRFRRVIRACYAIEVADVVRADKEALTALIIAAGFVVNLASAERVDRASCCGCRT